MPINRNREYRAMSPMAASVESEYIVEGYATTFDVPYWLYSYDGIDYFEVIDRHALDNADLSDVIFQFDHTGHVYARNSNGTLKLSTDDHGFKVVGDLSKTESARAMYEEIKTGLVNKMSWAFIVEEDSYNTTTHTRTILKVKKVYDVSAVSIPANADTDISARSFFDGVIKKEVAERQQRRKKSMLLTIKSIIGGE